ncbi:hypothetical protein [Microbacterium sp. PF5]|uniref:hypothetical protein n=1 Tax=Microbacterium sp. PF5 TaxID=2305435 RepID=UPI00109BB8DD|nr:hypothetical protein [Microbacterium sp. PF5]
MTFTPDVAGIMAQVLAVLLLATAFAPAYRGQLAMRTIRDENGEYHRVPTRRRAAVGKYAKVRIFLLCFVLAVVFADCLFVMYDVTLDDSLGASIPIAANTSALALTLANIGFAIYDHASDERQHGAD